eukprot:s1457_g8.t1
MFCSVSCSVRTAWLSTRTGVGLGPGRLELCLGLSQAFRDSLALYFNLLYRELSYATVCTRFSTTTMTSESSADSTWTFSGGVTARAVGESTADNTVVQSVDSSTEEDQAKPSSSAAPKVAPKAKSLSRASTPSRPTSAGSRTTKGNDRRNEAPNVPVMQALRLVAKGKDKGTRKESVRNRTLRQSVPHHPPMNVEDRGHVRSSLRDQLEAAQFAQQMYHQSEIQKLESVIQTLVAEMREMKQEDEGSEIRIQELERQRDTACQDQLRHCSTRRGQCKASVTDHA